ncbi:hypothetical protein [Myxococcus landrumensis]|uniref:Uncharacterized protein n=1 Tax=Myxococcus landrumensis TaxID=2813577 RepID=A0ABX7N6H5_9BACT|nr:hypothetical protein [Myxococcus landrumus]QSQ14053.1 hypothetical protein JY572_38025 [Myxococcus landrumus]
MNLKRLVNSTVVIPTGFPEELARVREVVAISTLTALASVKGRVPVWPTLKRHERLEPGIGIMVHFQAQTSSKAGWKRRRGGAA